MRIGIIGSGLMGSALGTVWAQAGHQVIFSYSRDAGKLQTLAQDAIIFGKNTYAPLAGYWQHAETSSNSAAERAFAKKINDMHKFVLSHGEVELAWKNSELLRVKDGAAFKQEIERLKNIPGKNIAVDAGEGAWRSFLEHDLWDGISMLVHPVVIGNGNPLFVSMPAKTPLRLVESKTYDNGVVSLRYERIEEENKNK